MASEYTYDEGGETWPFFIVAVLTFILVPLTIKWFHRTFTSDNPITRNKKIPGAIPEDGHTLGIEGWSVIRTFQLRQTSAKFFNKTLLVLILGWFTLIYIALYKTKEADLTGVFDPYAILQVAATASEREIKSKYRKLSLQYHPDKLPQNLGESEKEEMTANFVRLNSAYKALTDEATRENFLRYGHPDGPQDVSHGIAIPKFLVEGSYSKIMVGFYFLILGVVLPYFVFRWWSDVKRRTSKELHVGTAGLFARKLADRNATKLLTPFDILDWILQSEEVQEKFSQLEENEVRNLVFCYLRREVASSKDSSFEINKLQLVAILPKLIDGLIDIASVFRQADVIIAACDLRKSIFQAVKIEGRHQELLQLPYVDRRAVVKQPVRKLGKLFTLSEEELQRTLGLNEQRKLNTTMRIAAHIPTLHIIHVSFVVPGETTVPPLSNVHLLVKFLVKSPKQKSCPEVSEKESSNLSEEQDFEFLKDPLKSNDEQPSLPYSFTPYHPVPVTDYWSAFVLSQKDGKLVEGSEVMKMSNVDLSNLELSQEEWKEGKITVGSFRIPLGSPAPLLKGKYYYRLIMKSRTYFGNDVDCSVEMDVQDAPPLETQFEKTADESDDESDISDPEEESLAGMLASMKGQQVKKKEPVQSDDEGSEESEFTDINTDTEDES